jgi:TPR repeat protein
MASPGPPAVPAPPPAVRLPDAHAVELLARGQEAERSGDITAARRLYASAADRGSAVAARSLGRLYDPAFLGRTVIGGIDADPVEARRWYERATALGDPEAAPLLQSLSAR